MFDALKHVVEQSKNPQILEHRLRKSTFRFMCVCVLSLFKKTKSQLVKIFFHAPLGSRAMCRIASISIKCLISESWESLHSNPCWWSATEIAWGFSGRPASLSVPGRRTHRFTMTSASASRRGVAPTGGSGPPGNGDCQLEGDRANIQETLKGLQLQRCAGEEKEVEKVTLPQRSWVASNKVGKLQYVFCSSVRCCSSKGCYRCWHEARDRKSPYSGIQPFKYTLSKSMWTPIIISICGS